MKTRFIELCLALCLALPLHADTTARTIVYHAKDIVNIRAKVKYTTLIQLPPREDHRGGDGRQGVLDY